MKYFIILLSLISGICAAQTHRFIYEYSFAKDSLAPQQLTTELMNLDIVPGNSYFFSAVAEEADSVMQSRAAQNNFSTGDVKFSAVPDVVVKNYPDMGMLWFSAFDPINRYKIADNQKIAWKVLSDKKTIENLPVQRAEAKIFGRKWTAWFSPEIPFSDGPYKFFGLPGLILSVQDATNTHRFILKGIRNIPGKYRVPAVAQKTISNAMPASFAQFKKAYFAHRTDPNLALKQQIAAGGKVRLIDENGKDMDVDKFLRDEDRRIKEINSKDNNPLEINLLK